MRAVYDAVAGDYAAAFAAELEAKPFDRRLLDEFAAAIPAGGVICDVGCGAAGHLTRYLADCGVSAVGADVSPVSAATARLRQPQLAFMAADMRALPAPAGALAAIVAFYSVIHLPRAEVPRALAAFRRVLPHGGVLLLAMHGGSGELSDDDWFGRGVPVRVALWSLPALAAAVEAAGFAVVRQLARPPYPAEHPTERLYLWAEVPAG
jgi:SAM-dependent methyltransferase